MLRFLVIWARYFLIAIPQMINLGDRGCIFSDFRTRSHTSFDRINHLNKGSSYFESLERTVKTAFAVYLVLFISGMILTLLGANQVLAFLQTHSPTFSIIAGVFVAIIFALLIYVIGKVDWLGELHIRLDRRFFGFLEKSNEIIFHTLITALEPHERERLLELSADRKGKITQAIFSHISDDKELFAKLLKSGIFRIWIWYWISIYGTFTFTLVSLASFIVAWIQRDFFSKPFFTVNWILALAHLFVSIFIGRFLIEKTKSMVQLIVEAHQFDIANALITRIQDEPQIDEDKLYQESDSDS